MEFKRLAIPVRNQSQRQNINIRWGCRFSWELAKSKSRKETYLFWVILRRLFCPWASRWWYQKIPSEVATFCAKNQWDSQSAQSKTVEDHLEDPLLPHRRVRAHGTILRKLVNLHEFWSFWALWLIVLYFALHRQNGVEALWVLHIVNRGWGWRRGSMVAILKNFRSNPTLPFTNVGAVCAPWRRSCEHLAESSLPSFLVFFLFSLISCNCFLGMIKCYSRALSIKAGPI